MAKRNKEEQKIYDEYIKDLKGHEGYKSEVYPDGKDSEGRQLYSVGYGHQLTPEELEIYPPGSEVPKKVTDGWFSKDADKFYTLGKAEAAKYGRTDAAAIKGTANAMFNLGEAGFAGFKDMRQAMTEGRWGDVEKHAKDSKWFKEDAPTRTQYFVDNMLSPYKGDTKGNVIVPQKTDQLEVPVKEEVVVEQPTKLIPNGAIQEEPIRGTEEVSGGKKEERGILEGVGGYLKEKLYGTPDYEKDAVVKDDIDGRSVVSAFANMGRRNPEIEAGSSLGEDYVPTVNTGEYRGSTGKLLKQTPNEEHRFTEEQRQKQIEDLDNKVQFAEKEDGLLSEGWQGSLSDAFRNIGIARDKKQEMLSKIPRASNFSGSVKADLAGLQGVLNARATQFHPYARFGG